MGMDLIPINRSKDAPRDCVLLYNWSGWWALRDLLQEWGVLTNEFNGFANNGEKISAETCRAVADAIEKHLPELTSEEQDWLKPHIQRWRHCGGFRQW